MEQHQIPQKSDGQPRLPQIDPVTFSALNTLDVFLAKAPLTRQEHAEAAKCLQHLVQMIEQLQTSSGNFQTQPPPSGIVSSFNSSPDCAPATNDRAVPSANNGQIHGGTVSDGRVVSAEAAEEMFRRSRV